VLVKLLLEAGLSIFDTSQGAQRNLEDLAAHCADGNHRSASEILNDPKRTFRHVPSLVAIALKVDWEPTLFILLAGNLLQIYRSLAASALNVIQPSRANRIRWRINTFGRLCVRREDILKPDLFSFILMGAGALIIVILLLILVAAWTQAPALV
jgi:hypothetical protein